MSLDISRVRFEPLYGIGRLLYRQQGLLREWRSFVALSTSDFAWLDPAGFSRLSGQSDHARLARN